MVLCKNKDLTPIPPHFIHRMPCKAGKSVLIKNKQKEVRLINGVILLGWTLVPLVIVIMGFANLWVAFIY